MIFYLSTIFIAMILISCLNILLNPLAIEKGLLWLIIATIFAVVCEIIIDGIFAASIQALPKKYFTMDKKLFIVSKKEKNFYEKFGVKKWKDYILELGALNGFRKNKLREPDNPEYISRFIIECNKGFVIHIVDCVVGFAVIFLLPLKFWLTISMPVAIVNFILNLLPIIVLRYNNYKLKVVYNRMVRNRSKQKEL